MSFTLGEEPPLTLGEELQTARSRLYRSQILHQNMRWKALTLESSHVGKLSDVFSRLGWKFLQTGVLDCDALNCDFPQGTAELSVAQCRDFRRVENAVVERGGVRSRKWRRP